jgi:hypothetical protein
LWKRLWLLWIAAGTTVVLTRWVFAHTPLALDLWSHAVTPSGLVLLVVGVRHHRPTRPAICRPTSTPSTSRRTSGRSSCSRSSTTQSVGILGRLVALAYPLGDLLLFVLAPTA